MNLWLKGGWKPLVSMLFALTLVACGNGSGSNTSNPSPVYTMIFDAGSSGTRLSFFKVIPGGGGYPQITLIETLEYDDNGINDFIMNEGEVDPTDWPAGYSPTGCSSYINLGADAVGPCVLQPLLDAMAPYMSQYGVTANQIKVELYATAGMRTVALFNGGSKSEGQIYTFYQTLKNYVSNIKGFAVGEFRTSNGNSEEGVWTWTNLNDQYYNAFGGNKTYYSGTPTTRGDFEVGGSSMQIAFPTNSIAVGDANNVYPVKINGYTYNVYSKTFLGLGGDDARKFMRSYGYLNATGYNSGLDCFGSKATASNTVENSGVVLFYNNYIFPNSLPATTAVDIQWQTIMPASGYIFGTSTPTPLTLSGQGNYNWATCSGKYNAVTDAVMALPRNSYGTVPDQATPASYGSFTTKVGQSSAPFVGLDNFFYSAEDLGLAVDTTVNNPVTQAQFAQKIGASGTVCSNGGTGPDPNPGKNVTKSGMSTCPSATFMQDFLWRTGGLFTSGTGATFEGVVPTVMYNNTPQETTVLTWTRGYLLLKYAN